MCAGGLPSFQPSHGTREAQQSAACRVVVARRPYGAKREDLAGHAPVGDPRKLRDGRGFAGERKTATNCDQGKHVIPTDMLAVNLGVMAELPEASDQIVVNLLARRRFADDETLSGQIDPCKFRSIRKRVICRENGKYLFRPELLDFAAVPWRSACKERHVQLELPHGSNVLGGVSIDEIDANAVKAFAVGAQQIEQEAGRDGGEDPDFDMALLRLADSRDVIRAGEDMLEGGSSPRQIFLSGDREADAACVAMKERCSELILEIADTATDRRFLEPEGAPRLPETSIFCGGHEITQMVQFDPVMSFSPERKIGKGADLGAVRKTSAVVIGARHQSLQRVSRLLATPSTKAPMALSL